MNYHNGSKNTPNMGAPGHRNFPRSCNAYELPILGAILQIPDNLESEKVNHIDLISVREKYFSPCCTYTK